MSLDRFLLTSLMVGRGRVRFRFLVFKLLEELYRREGVRARLVYLEEMFRMDRTLEFQALLYLERGEGGQSEGEVSGPVCGEGGFTCLGCGLISAEEWAAVSG